MACLNGRRAEQKLAGGGLHFKEPQMNFDKECMSF